jgi:hypothetical protein
VTPIKNQEQCGSCWAFSTTGSVEGVSFISTGTLPSVSEQQLVDCSGAEGNQGCNGGLMDYGFEYIIKNKGITGETNYPYTAKDGTCAAAGKPVVATISGYKDVPVNSEVGLETAIVTQPVSVAVEADQSVFQYYTGGVMDSACGTQLDHGVLAVGYGTEGGKEYFKVKNSWGADWGAKGYILLARGAKFNPSGQCGIQMVRARRAQKAPRPRQRLARPPRASLATANRARSFRRFPLRRPPRTPPRRKRHAAAAAAAARTGEAACAPARGDAGE